MFNNSPKRFRFVSARLIEVEQDFRRNIIIFFFNPLNDDILHDLFKRKFKSRVATNICNLQGGQQFFNNSRYDNRVPKISNK